MVQLKVITRALVIRLHLCYSMHKRQLKGKLGYVVVTYMDSKMGDILNIIVDRFHEEVYQENLKISIDKITSFGDYVSSEVTVLVKDKIIAQASIVHFVERKENEFNF